MITQQDIDIFLNKAQQRIVALSAEARALEDEGSCVDDNIDLINKLGSAINLLQEDDGDDFTDDQIWEIISFWNKEAKLTKLPLGIFDSSCLVDTVLVGAGYLEGPTGPTGPQGPIGPTGPQGEAGTNGTDGTDGTDGWSPIYAVVDDGSRKVLQVTGWTGGTGTPPASGSYLGSSGFVLTAAEAVDIRGSQGPIGATGATGATGAAGNSSYTYIAYASDDNGNDFTTTFDENLDYFAIRTTTSPISIPSAGDFAGLWKKYKGEPGAAFQVDAQGPLSERSIYDAEATPFWFLATDTGDVYFKQSNVLGDWSDPISFVGEKGWSPICAVVTDGDRRVLQIVDWTGGQGTAPSTTNQYIGPLGIVETAAEAVDIRGAMGQVAFPDEQGTTAGRDAFDDELQDFIYYSTELGQVSIKLSDDSADWSEWVDWRGPQGVQGPVGSPGSGLNADCDVTTSEEIVGTYSSGSKTLTVTALGPLTVDDVELALNDRVLVKDQSTESENGIYYVSEVGVISISSTVLTRADDMNLTSEVQKFIGVFISSGTDNANKFFGLDTDREALVLDTTSLSFEETKGYIASDEAFAASWANSILPPTKNAVYAGFLPLEGKVLSTDMNILANGNAVNIYGDSSPLSEPYSRMSIGSSFAILSWELNAFSNYRFLATSTGLLMGYTDSDPSESSIRISSTAMTVTDSQSSKGLVYAADYSANFVARTLIDKGYADATYLALAGGIMAGNLDMGTNNIINGTLANFGAFVITGTGGNGYVSFPSQSGTASPPVDGFTLFADSSARPAWTNSTDGFKRTIAGTLSANRVYTLPNKDITFAGINDETFTGTTNFAAISVAPDTDVTSILGRMRVHSVVTDRVYISHYDLSGSGDYAVRISNAGELSLNAPTGQSIFLGINGAVSMTVQATAISVGSLVTSFTGANAVLNFSSDIDNAGTPHILGRAKIGTVSAQTDRAYFSHFDFFTNTSFALMQDGTASGDVYVNTPTGRTLFMCVAGAARISLTNTTATFASAITTITGSGASVSFNADTDSTHTFGRARIFSATSDNAMFGHFDHATTTNYGIKVNASAATTVNSASGQNLVLAINNTAVGTISSSAADFAQPVGVPSYTVAGVPSASTAGRIIYVSDEAGGAVLAFSDGTNWRRVTDRNVIS